MPSNEKTFRRSFEQYDERRPFVGHGHLDVLKFPDGTTVGKAVFEPGWKWSVDIKPLAGTESCDASHNAYLLSGQMRIRMNSGEEFTIKAGDVIHIPPGHDAWVVGNESCVILDFGGFEHYATRSAEKAA